MPGEAAPARQDIRSILVIDDHPLFCEALAMTLQSVLHLSTIRTANSLAAGMEILDTGLEPDAIVLDLNLPDVSGVDGLVRLKSRTPHTPVVVVSALDSNSVVKAVIAGGAAGFIRKDAPREKLVSAFSKIWSGEIYTPEDYTPGDEGSDAEASIEDVVERLASLTPQQTKILELVCEGKLNKQIAYELSIAETTVKAHITAILRKLGVHSRTQAVLVSKQAQFSSILK